VLFVDDDVTLLRLFATALAGHVERVEATSDPCHALELVRERPFDVAVLDVAMPAMSGPELATRMRTIAPTLPVLLFSGSLHDVEPATLAALEPCETLSKPATVRELLDAIACAAGWLPDDEHAAPLPPELLLGGARGEAAVARPASPLAARD
jgi:CheY-like chemotaxis protein